MCSVCYESHCPTRAMQNVKGIAESASNCDRKATAIHTLQVPCRNLSCLAFQQLTDFELREILEFASVNVGVREQAANYVFSKLT